MYVFKMSFLENVSGDMFPRLSIAWRIIKFVMF